MGCWNETCGLTNLPIFHGDDTVCFLITPNPQSPTLHPASDVYHAQGLWHVFGFPIHGKYDDYGWIEDIQENSLTAYTLAQLDEKLVEMPLGENTYHDIPAERGKMTMDYINDLTKSSRGRLRIKNWAWGDDIPKVLPVLPLYMRRDMVDAAINAYRCDMWDADERHENQSVQDAEIRLRNKVQMFRDLTENDELAAFRIEHRIFRDQYRSLSDQMRYILDKPRTDAEADLFCAEFIRLHWLLMAMAELRKGIAPTIGAGSQSDGFDMHIPMIAAMQDCINRKKEEWDW